MRIDRRLFQYIRYVPLYLGALALLSALTGLLIVGQAYFLSQIIDRVLFQKANLELVLPMLGLLLLVILIRTSTGWISEVIASRTASYAKSQLRQRLFVHLQKLGPTYLKGERSGELAHTATEGVEALDAYFSQVLPQICSTIIIPAVVIVFVFFTDILSGVVLLVTLPLLPVFMILIGKQVNVETQKRWHLLSRLSAHFLDVLQGISTLRLFGRNRIQQETIQRISMRYGDTTMQVLRVAFLSALVMEIGASISMAIVAVEIGLRLLYGLMAFAPALLVLLLAPEYYQPLRALGPQFHASMESAASAQRIFDILDTPLPAQHSDQLQPINPTPEQLHELTFHNVSYAYPNRNGEEQQVLQGISFQARMGQTIAIVGASGAGKSTIAHLLLRFDNPTRGEILADGIPINSYEPASWRKLVAWQPQRPYLFTSTIAEAIKQGRTDASMDDVMVAAKQAAIHDFIETLPQGYQTPIGERGVRLSGGEAQRLSLARALLKNAPLLILDEATSTLDSEAEIHVQRSLNALCQNHITLIIAHRLHTIREADTVLVLQAGQIIASGTHTTLQQNSPLYRQLLQAYVHEEVR